jgi:superfamily II DNA or RNA helicase
MEQVSGFSNPQAVNTNIVDYDKEGVFLTPKGPETHGAQASFIGRLKHHQEKVFQTFGNRNQGIIIGPAGSGKKFTALYQIAQKKVPALIIVHDESRLREWIELIRSALKIPGEVEGSIEEGFYRFGNLITIAISHCLRENADRVPDDIGMVVIDECQRADLKIVLLILVALKPSIILGLARDPFRKDGLGKTMTEKIGPILVHFEPAINIWQLSPGGVLKTRQTGFQCDDPDNHTVMTERLYHDKARNTIIVQDILHEAGLRGGKVLVVSKSTVHLMELNRLLVEAQQTTGVMSDTTPENKCAFLIGQFMDKKIQVLLTTIEKLSTPYVFDCQALVLASPCHYGFPLILATAPLLGTDAFSPAVLYDYLDGPAVLKSLYKRRIKKYERLGIGKTVSAYFVH